MGLATALTFHNLDGDAILVERTQVAFIRPAKVGRRLCTRIRLSSGSDLIVKELASEVTKKLDESDRGGSALQEAEPSPVAAVDSFSGEVAPIKLKYCRSRNRYSAFRPRPAKRRLKMLRTVVPALTSVVVLLVLLTYSHKGVSAHSRKALLDPSAHSNVSDTAKTVPIDSSQCEAQARSRFSEVVEQTASFGGYRTHFDSSMGKCFVLITATTMSPKHSVVSMTLLDAFAGDNFGYYAAPSENGRPISTTVPTVCEVSSIVSGQIQYCASNDEFQSLLKPYME